MLILFFSLIIISYSQSRSKEDFNLNYVKISNFTLHFTNLNLKGEIIESEISRFCKHLFLVYYYEKNIVNNFIFF